MSRILVFLFAAFFMSTVWAQPVAVAQQGNTEITLTDEPCAFDFLNHDSYRRLKWREGKVVYEGCWGVTQMGIVVAWTEDKALSAIPSRVFHKVEGI